MRQGFLYKKATQALNYFAIKEGGSINKMKALKLIWLTDRYHLRQYGRPILNDTYFALKNGAVASNTKDLAYQAKDFLENEEATYVSQFLITEGEFNFKSIKEANLSVFSNSEVKAMDLIYSAFGGYDHFKLSDLSHEYPEWSKFKDRFTFNTQSYRFEMDYNDFFLNPPQNNHPIFNQSEDFLKSSAEFFC